MDWWFVILSGLAVAGGTGVLLGPRKAMQLPGGSVSVGIMAWWSHGLVPALDAAFLGFVGWVIYCVLVRALTRHTATEPNRAEGRPRAADREQDTQPLPAYPETAYARYYAGHFEQEEHADAQTL